MFYFRFGKENIFINYTTKSVQVSFFRIIFGLERLNNGGRKEVDII